MNIIPESDGKPQSGALHLHLPDGTNEQPVVMPQSPKGESGGEQYYTQEEGTNDEHYQEAAPFQVSSSMPALGTGQRVQQLPASVERRPFPLVRVILLVSIILVIILAGVMIVEASAAPTMATQSNRTIQPAPNPTATPTGGPGTWIPQQLPTGWTDNGLTTGDALEASRTAATFTDREMSIDYRSIGTRANHGGTMTAAVFLLTPAAMTRFRQNDIRVINNVFFDQVQQEKRIQAAVNAQPQLMKFATQGMSQLAWVDVAFSLWQSKTVNGQPSAGLEIDQGTSQPRVHHMMVLLLRVLQNANGAMGGTGWLVSAYALNLPAGQMLDIPQPA